MEEQILVDRNDGPAVAGLVTGLLAHWDEIPLNMQAAILDHASRVAFDALGRTDGRYIVTAFVLKYRAAIARRDRHRNSFGFRVRDVVDKLADQRRRMIEAAAHWPLQWLSSLRRAA